MNNTGEFEKVFLLYALQNPHYLTTVEKGFFEIKEIDTLAVIVKAYWNKFKQTPTKEQLWLLVRSKEVEMDEKFYDKVFENALSTYDIEWVKKTAESWILWKNLDSSLTDTLEFVSTQQVSPENVDGIIRQVKDIINGRNSITFSNDLGLSFYNPADHKLDALSTISTNYQFADRLMGGYTKKTLNVYVAPPNTGKSLFMAHDAAEYIKKGKNVIYVTLEMIGQKVLKRIGANILGISMDDYETKSRDADFMAKKIKAFQNQSLLDPGELRVIEFPTSSATVDDIDSYLKNLEETTGTKFDIVIVDYINILRDIRNPNTEQTYIKIKNISEDLRAFAQKNDVVVISATQTNRGGFDSTEVTMANIAESAGLAHTADNIMAIIQDSEMNLDKQYWLKLLKVRDGAGKHTKCLLNIDYNYMILSETDTLVEDN